MSNVTRKMASVGLSLTTAVWLSGAAAIVPVVSAQTSVEDLQAQITALLAQIQTLQAQLTAQGGVTPVVGATTKCTFTRSLTIGVKGDDVKCLQQYLNSAGHKVAESGVGSMGSETTYFGSLTQSAVAKWQAAQSVSPAVGYFGPISRAKYDSVAMVVTPGTGTTPGTPATPGTPGVVIPASGIALALASDNPSTKTIPKGVSGLNVLKFTVAGNGTLNSLKFKRQGIGGTADFQSAGIALYEGTKRLTSGKTLNSTTHEILFPNLGLAISGVRTFWLSTDVAPGATAGNVNRFMLVEALGTPNPTGTLTGSDFTIGGQAVGGLDPTSGAAPTNPRIGQVGAILQEFKLTASSTEDVELKQISLIEGGTIANGNLSNFVLKQGDKVLATVSEINSKDLVTFVLDTPFLIEKGQQKTFRLYGDVSGAARSGDTIVFYFDQSSDIIATGKTYGFTVAPTITSLDAASEADTLTVQGGQVTITFNGPIASNVPTRAQDLTVFDFTLASGNNVEIRNLRFHATTTGLISGEGFNDFKVWDVAQGSVVTSASDITTSSDITFTDVLTMSAGESRRFKATVDVDPDNDASDDILISLLAFQASDIKNLDNNQFVAVADIVPNATVAGNTQTVQAPTLDVQLSLNPSSQTYVRGSSNKPLVGVSLAASNDDIKISTLKFTSTGSTGTLGSGEALSYGIYEGTTLISKIYTFSGSVAPYTISFDNLDYTIKKGQTKLVTLQGSIDTNADANDIYYFYVAAADSDNITAVDSDGNAPTISGSAANNGGTVLITIANVGDVTVAKAPNDAETEAGIIVAGGERTLAKFKFTATDEAMTLNDMQLLVVSSSTATATSSNAADEITAVKLYDGATQIGDISGYVVQGSGANSGVADIEDIGFVVPKDGSKTITVKGVVNTITGGADAGASVFVSVMATGWEAQGATAKDTAITAATGNEKVVYKTKPTITLPTQSYTLTAGDAQEAFSFTVAADSAEDVSWKKIQLQVAMTDASMAAVGAAPSTTGNVSIKDVNVGTTIDIVSAFSGTGTASTGQAGIAGGLTGYVTLVMSAEEQIAAGGSKTYEVGLPFTQLSTAAGASPTAKVKLYLQETATVTATTYNGVETSTTDGQPSFIWSDHSATTHSETSADWFNGRYVKTLPSVSKSVVK
jgi:hypothetical protein